ncbi:MAG: hypothetical protein [Podoviridae sp. ctLUJ1]|nr:MAG: hypothetical protein [Podoviridae sp. ctLUJ1]
MTEPERKTETTFEAHITDTLKNRIAHGCMVMQISKEAADAILNANEPMIKAHNVNDAKRVLPQHIMDKIDTIEMVTHFTLTGKVQRSVVINMINGFGVTGEPSVSVTVENDREEIGTQIALRNAVDRIWQLEGYLKCQELYEAKLKDKLKDE